MNTPLRIMYRKARRKVSRARVSGRFGYRKKVTSEQFRDARVYAGLTREQAADLVGVSLRTIGHWETGAARPTYAAFKLLRVLRHGDIADPRWSGYSFVRGKLVTPENHTFEPSDMTWWSLTCRMAHAFRERCRQDAQARSAELGLVHYSTSDTPSPESLAAQGSPVLASGLEVVDIPALHGANLAPYWPQNEDFSPVSAMVSRGDGPRSNTGQKSADLAQGGVA